MPPNINSGYGHTVDRLYYLIMIIVLVMFFLTEGFLIYSIIKFRRREGQRASYLHGSNKAEIIWTVIPGMILVWLALYQSGTWDDIRTSGFYKDPQPAVMVQGFPEQFVWHFRFPGPDGKFGTKDDIAVNDLHVPVNKKIAVYLSSKDVIHSFFIPNARVKMDSVPGMLTRTWFTIDKIPVWNLKSQEVEFLTETELSGKKVALGGIKRVDGEPDVHGVRTLRFQPDASKKAQVLFQGKVSEMAQTDAEYQMHYVEIACAELCGLGHTKMRTTLTIEPEDQYKAWLTEQGKFQDVSIEKWNGIWDVQHPEFNGKP
jgi:heme/copper-type cytochrome/quinol oxidase subunit 2